MRRLTFGKLEITLSLLAVVFMIAASVFLGGCSQIEVDCLNGKVTVSGEHAADLARSGSKILENCPKGLTNAQ